MKCPQCRDGETQVRDSRPVAEGSIIRRRRLCFACGVRFTTYERMHPGSLTQPGFTRVGNARPGRAVRSGDPPAGADP